MIYRNNDNIIWSDQLLDDDGVPITTGTVEAAILSPDEGVTHVAADAMAHDANGYWSRTIDSASIASIPAADDEVLVVVTYGSPADATWKRLEHVTNYRTSS